MKQEPGRQQPGISGLQAGEDVKSTEYNESILTDNWQLPTGAFGESDGPM